MEGVALGFKPHSGWAAVVAVAGSVRAPEVLRRERLLVAPADALGGKHPYHAAERLAPAAREAFVRNNREAAGVLALRELRTVLDALRAEGREVVACGVLAGSAMPAWSVAEIVAVHLRMHQAEGELFREVWTRAAEACGLGATKVPERGLLESAARALATTPAALQERLDGMKRALGPPWGKDQKEAVLAAWVARAPRR